MSYFSRFMSLLKRIFEHIKNNPLHAFLFILVVLIIFALFFFWPVLGTPSLKLEGVKTFILSLGGVGGFYGLVLAYRRQEEFSKQVDIGQRQVDNAQEQLFNERLGRGVQLLSDAKMTMRCAGIRVLENLAETASKSQNRLIIEILRDYVIESSPLSSKKQDENGVKWEGEMAEIIDKNEKKIADIELAIKLIFEYAGKADLKDEAIMLSTLDLDKADLTSIKKMIQEPKITLQNISGYKIKFNRANIKGLEINRSVFPSAEFIEGKLNRVIFDSVLLHSANFFNADLTEICFCNINNVYFDGKLYRLEESSKENTNFKHIRFRKAIMCRAILSGQIFENCNFKEANLSAADLSGAIFRASKGGITLSHDRHKTQGRYEIATFEDANLSDADLSEADMSGARGLTQAQIDEIIFEESNPPTLPDGLIPPANRAYITQKDKDGKTHRYFIKSEAKWSEQSVDEYLNLPI